MASRCFQVTFGCNPNLSEVEERGSPPEFRFRCSHIHPTEPKHQNPVWGDWKPSKKEAKESAVQRALETWHPLSPPLPVPLAPAPRLGRVRMSPGSIFFTHDSIKGTFRDGRLVRETLRQLLMREIEPSAIPTMSVCWHPASGYDARFWTYTGNRRLWVFRQLEGEGLVEDIEVLVVDETVSKKHMTTKNGGATLRVRGEKDIAANVEQRPTEEAAAASQESFALPAAAPATADAGGTPAAPARAASAEAPAAKTRAAPVAASAPVAAAGPAAPVAAWAAADESAPEPAFRAGFSVVYKRGAKSRGKTTGKVLDLLTAFEQAPGAVGVLEVEEIQRLALNSECAKDRRTQWQLHIKDLQRRAKNEIFPKPKIWNRDDLSPKEQRERQEVWWHLLSMSTRHVDDHGEGEGSCDDVWTAPVFHGCSSGGGSRLHHEDRIPKQRAEDEGLVRRGHLHVDLCTVCAALQLQHDRLLGLPRTNWGRRREQGGLLSGLPRDAGRQRRTPQAEPEGQTNRLGRRRQRLRRPLCLRAAPSVQRRPRQLDVPRLCGGRAARWHGARRESGGAVPARVRRQGEGARRSQRPAALRAGARGRRQLGAAPRARGRVRGGTACSGSANTHGGDCAAVPRRRRRRCGGRGAFAERGLLQGKTEHATSHPDSSSTLKSSRRRGSSSLP